MASENAKKAVFGGCPPIRKNVEKNAYAPRICANEVKMRLRETKMRGELRWEDRRMKMRQTEEGREGEMR